jgi:hypothetical protein
MPGIAGFAFQTAPSRAFLMPLAEGADMEDGMITQWNMATDAARVR